MKQKPFPVTQKPSQAYIMLETVIKVLYYRGTTQIDESPTLRCTNIHSSLITGSDIPSAPTVQINSSGRPRKSIQHPVPCRFPPSLLSVKFPEYLLLFLIGLFLKLCLL